MKGKSAKYSELFRFLWSVLYNYLVNLPKCWIWFKKLFQVQQRDVPGIDCAFLAMDTEEGVEVVWNEVQISEKKSSKVQLVSFLLLIHYCWMLMSRNQNVPTDNSPLWFVLYWYLPTDVSLPTFHFMPLTYYVTDMLLANLSWQLTDISVDSVSMANMCFLSSYSNKLCSNVFYWCGIGANNPNDTSSMLLFSWVTSTGKFFYWHVFHWWNFWKSN